VSGYTKLFGSLIHSTIWREPDHVRIVWMTMLAMADRDGVVEASVPGLADAARKSIPETEAALARLTEPDPYSRTPDHEGRRIEAVLGGWRLLNHAIYREKASTEEAREKAAARQARKRERDMSRSVTLSHAESREITPVTQSHDIAEAEATPSPHSGVRARVARTMPGSSIDCPDPLGEHETVSSLELPWRTWVAASRKRGMRVTDSDRRRELRHVEDIERRVLELVPDVAEARGMLPGDAARALVALAYREYGRLYDESNAEGFRGKPLPWRLGFVVARWAELTKDAIPAGAT
jgi:hypothetical protein